jgi:hypothetical protein
MILAHYERPSVGVLHRTLLTPEPRASQPSKGLQLEPVGEPAQRGGVGVERGAALAGQCVIEVRDAVPLPILSLVR